MKKFIALFLALNLALVIAFCTGCNAKKGVQVFDADGNEIATFKTLSDDFSEVKNYEYHAYLEMVLKEAEQAIANSRSLSKEKARAYLVESNCSIHTSFSGKVYDAIKNGYKGLNYDEVSSGCTVADLHGNILAVYSSGTSGENYATMKTPPYSTFKPLSVYTPAIENSIVNWSTVYEDSPVKKIKDENGKITDWPANATNTYSNINESLEHAVKVSLNTVAVRCMQDIGVKNSLAFMEEKFDLILDYEKLKTENEGQDETIGNIALGYLNQGVSTVDMVGYYQVFANGGRYSKPHTILKVCNKIGNIICENKSNKDQVIKSSTAYIMNKLLQNVVSPGGTGVDAMCDGVVVGGKTGTGDVGNWFVGFTPQYTCAVWHGKELANNNASKIFSSVVNGLDNDDNKFFPSCDQVEKAAYCSESGMLFSAKCRKINLGYYVLGELPEICNKH